MWSIPLASAAGTPACSAGPSRVWLNRAAPWSCGIADRIFREAYRSERQSQVLLGLRQIKSSRSDARRSDPPQHEIAFPHALSTSYAEYRSKEGALHRVDASVAEKIPERVVRQTAESACAPLVYAELCRRAGKCPVPDSGILPEDAPGEMPASIDRSAYQRPVTGLLGAIQIACAIHTSEPMRPAMDVGSSGVCLPPLSGEQVLSRCPGKDDERVHLWARRAPLRLFRRSHAHQRCRRKIPRRSFCGWISKP
jgi:hypothetical protein